MSYALNSQGDHSEARRLAHRLIEMTGDRASGAWRCLGQVEFNEGHFDRAVDLHTKAYKIDETRTNNLGAYTLNPSMLGVILAASGHDPGELVEQGFARARAARWPTALAFAHYAAGEAIQQTDPVAALEQDERGHALALEVGNRLIEALTQSSINYLQSVLLPPVERAAAADPSTATPGTERHGHRSDPPQPGRRSAGPSGTTAYGSADLRLVGWTIGPKRANRRRTRGCGRVSPASARRPVESAVPSGPQHDPHSSDRHRLSGARQDRRRRRFARSGLT